MGRRGRFLLSSHDPSGDWLAYGWRDGLRMVSDVVEPVQDLDEPAVWVQEERDFYGKTKSINRYAVGLSRVWVEQYVSCESPTLDVRPQEAWLEELNRDPNEPTLRRLHAAQGFPDPVGRRIVLMDGTDAETDLRAVSPVRMTDDGELAIAVMAERDWYRWGERSYGPEPHPSLRWMPAAQVWVE
ncbi:hypothetical protein [Knoellia sp. p5-6-4]|uniref:hypothetical protein n=1 Tax=unclassified Knoellia TaxID=2618719 RepID=UPI0023DB8B62|nr:hypothetical protein [Knoellia sp. p5-6-4]MDF2144648.1 hypothetical protein [Knoellia sp. p5-6-4]